MLVVASLLLAAGHPLPKAVAAFVERQGLCTHWRGEEPYDAARAREIALNERRACRGLERERARLRRIHRNDPAVLAALRPED